MQQNIEIFLGNRIFMDVTFLHLYRFFLGGGGAGVLKKKNWLLQFLLIRKHDVFLQATWGYLSCHICIPKPSIAGGEHPGQPPSCVGARKAGEPGTAHTLSSLLQTVILKAARTVALVSVNAVLCKAAPSGEEHYGHVQKCLSFILQMSRLSAGK